jgi:plastocyanin
MLADRTVRLAAAVAASLALVACGETTRIKPTAHATPRDVPTVPATVFPAPTTTAPAEPSESASAQPSPSAGGSSAATGGNEVKTDSTANKFLPATLTVKAGTKVTWTADQPYHSVTSGEPGKPDAKGPMQGKIGFTTYAVTFAKAGTYKYFCEPHASLGMTGEIVVT